MDDATTTKQPATESGIGRRRSAARKDSSASYSAKRQEIAEAAVRVFNRLGFERASIAAVAEEMGVDRASLYYYISSKEQLLTRSSAPSSNATAHSPSRSNRAICRRAASCAT